MAVRASREVVFEAPPEAILDALADIDQVPAWSIAVVDAPDLTECARTAEQVPPDQHHWMSPVLSAP